MAGWFEAFGNFMGGAAPSFDRYQALRQLDVENQFKRKQQEMQQQQEAIRSQELQTESARRSALHERQMKALDTSILKQEQDMATQYRMPNTDMTPEDAQNFRGPLQLGGLVQSEQRYKPTLDLSALGMENPTTTNPNVSEQMGLAPVEQTQSSHDVYTGTPAQAEQLRQRRLMMAIAQGMPDEISQARVLMGEPPTYAPRQPNPPATPFSNPMETIINGKSVWADPRTRQVIPELGTPPPKSSGSGGGNNQQNIDPDQLERAAAAILEQRMSPSQASSFYGGMGNQGFKRAVADRVTLINPKFDFQAAESNYQYGKNPGTQTTARFMENIQGTIPLVRDMVKKMKLGDVRIMNAATLATKGQFGVGDVAAFNFVSVLLADEIAKILQGGGTGNATSDAKLKQANDLLHTDMSPDQWNDVLDIAEEMLKVRSTSLKKGTYMDPNRNEDSAEKWELVNGILTLTPKVKK